MGASKKKKRNSVSKSIFHPTTSQNMSQIILIYRYLPLHLYITAHLIVRSHSRSEELSEAIICIPFGLFFVPLVCHFFVCDKVKKERKSFFPLLIFFKWLAYRVIPLDRLQSRVLFFLFIF